MSTSVKSEFLVIGAGYGRTGTLSLKHALEIILPGKCHHMVTAFSHQEEWCDILSGKMGDEEVKEFLMSDNYVAAVDAPFCFIYERAMKLFPDAKVILSVREPNGWLKSTKSTVLRAANPFESPVLLFLATGLFDNYLGMLHIGGGVPFPGRLFNAMKGKMQPLKRAVEEGKGVDFFNKWNNDVESNVDASRLLKFNVREGWAPLCNFLKVPIPDVPFPNINSSADFARGIDLRNRRSWLLLYELISLPILSWGVYMLSRK